MGDVIERVISGQDVATLSEAEVEDVQAYLDDPENGVSPHVRRLILRLIEAVRTPAPPARRPPEGQVSRR